MVPAGSNQTLEIIWHFAGHFHLHDQIARSREFYDGVAQQRPIDDFRARPVAEKKGPDDDDDPASLRSPEPAEVGTPFVLFDPIPSAISVVGHGALRPGLFATLDRPAPMSLDSPAAAASGGKSIIARLQRMREGQEGDTGSPDNPAELKITVQYDDWADQRLMVIGQVNQTADLDMLIVNGNPQLGSLNATDVPAALQDLMAQAETALPSDFKLPSFDAPSMVTFVTAHQAAVVSAPEVEAPIENGLYIDGTLQPETVKHEPVPAPEKPNIDLPTTSGSVGLSAELGGNTQYNLAQIVDANEAATSIVVLGDHMTTNAIVQVNVYKDDDQVSAAGPGLEPDQTENSATNIAELSHEPVFDEPLPVSFAGPEWNVDRLTGDFYDVKLLTQINWMIDSDFVVQTTEDSYSRLVSGDTVQTNLASLADLGSLYDLIIIGGDMHVANIIFQKNMLIDDDVLKVASAADGEDQAALSVSWSGNTLLNDATIQGFGASGTSGVPDDIAQLVTAIQGGQEELGSEFASLLPGDPGESFDVLYITGSYYDVNVVAQYNVMADTDTALQLMPDIEPPNEDGLAQDAATGGNTLINTAAIVDVGATSLLHVGGKTYEDVILVQANLVAGEGESDTLTFGDTETLVTEVMAFTGPDEAEAEPETEPVKDYAMHDDVVGSVLH